MLSGVIWGWRGAEKALLEEVRALSMALGAAPDWKFKNQLAAVGGALDAGVAGIFMG